MLLAKRPRRTVASEAIGGRSVAGASRARHCGEVKGLGTTVAFLAECQGSASIDEQKACLEPDDLVVVAGRQSFNKIGEILAQNGLRLGAGDRLKVHDLACISLSTPTLIRSIVRMLRKGIAFQIVSAGLTIEPNGADRLHALLDVLEGHYRHLHGVKTHPVDRRGRKTILGPEQLPEIRAKLARPGATASDVARELGVARTTLFNYLVRHDASRHTVRSEELG